jgi:hypothetical protein
MQHLNEEQLVSHYYHDDDAPAAAESHLASCAECRAQLETIRRVLALVRESPVPDRGDAYGEEVWTRLRWKMGSRRRRTIRWSSLAAAAAVLAIAFFAGQWWHAHNAAKAPIQSASMTNANNPQLTGSTRVQQDRVLYVVVSDHLESSERMLTELANADPRRGFDVTSQQSRAADLVASNRIYRQTAASRGDRRITALLSDLEPILVELSHAGKTLSADELTSIQKRIDSKNLLFKVRVMSAQGGGGDYPPTANPNSNSL